MDTITKARDLIAPLKDFTPGPWTFETESGEWPDHALIGGTGDPVIEWDFDLGFRLSDPDARLITAAPELRDTLAALVDHADALTAERDALRERVAAVVAAYDRALPMRQADWHGEDCDCLRCEVDRARAARRSTREGG